MLQDLLRLMQGGGFGLYPLTMLHDLDYKPEPSIVRCPSKSTFVVNGCHVYAQWFRSNDVLVASCGHMYHVPCMAYYAGFHPC
jgi:hypothetical protein